MGLTIHYNLRSNTRSPQKARELVAQLHHRALDLPFERVDEIIELADRRATLINMTGNILVFCQSWNEGLGRQLYCRPESLSTGVAVQQPPQRNLSKHD